MKKNCFFPLMIFAIVFFLTNGCKKDGSSDDDNNNTSSLTISSLSKYSAMPASLLAITGSGFSADDDLWVRFSDLYGYQIDVPVIQTDGVQLLVSVPPFINISTEDWEAGTVSVQVINKKSTGDVVSNSINNFDIVDMPVAQGKTGMATLIFMEEQIKYFKQVQQEMTGTELASPEMISSVAMNISNLEALYSNIEKVVNTPGGLSTYFTYGSINGQEIKIGLKQLGQCDRFILALFAALSDPNLSDPFESFSNNKSIDFNPCSVEALEAQAGLTSGQNNGETYNSMGCMASALPNAINSASNVIFGAGAVGLGIVTLVAIGFEVPVAMAIALPTAAILYATVGTAGLEVATGAILKNINNNAAVQAIHSGVDRIENMFRGMLLDFVLPKTIGAYKNLLDGNNSLGEAFGDSNTGTDCTYLLSATSFQANAAGGSGTLSVTTQTGCTWTANSGYSWITVTSGSTGSGNGTVGYAIQANTSNQERTGSIQIADKNFAVNQEANTQVGSYEGQWFGSFDGVHTYLSGNTYIWEDELLEIAIEDNSIISFTLFGEGPISAYGNVDNTGQGTWQPSYSGYTPFWIFTGTFQPDGTASGTWTETIPGTGEQAGSGSGTWTATRE